VTRLDALAVGVAAWRLGAGRARKEDAVSATAGVRCLVKPGDYVRRGQQMLELLADGRDRLEYAVAALDGAADVDGAPPPPRPLIVQTLGR
jgi:thymidine phosphorylase